MSPAVVCGCDVATWRCTPPLPHARYRALCREMALDGFKWDAQVGDTATLAPFAVVLPRAAWSELAWLAEGMASELSAVETELMARPDLWRALGLPPRVRAALQRTEPWTPTAARVVRFDFHPTEEGWRVSEANSDVPGGYTEAGRFTAQMAALTEGGEPAGDPGAVLCAGLAAQAQSHGRVALLAAPGYVEDRQVVEYLGDRLRRFGVSVACVRPEQLQWRAGVAHVGEESSPKPVDVIFRFYQGEWMTRVAGDDWRWLFRGGRTAVCNPAAAVLSESKRLPALASELATAMPTWCELMPATRPARAAWDGGDWVLKRSYSNNGDAVLSRRWARGGDYAWALAHGLVAPAQWTAQRRFETLALSTPMGPMRPCLGVYVVNGRACGVYGRLAAHPVIDFRAVDAAILIEETP